MELIIAGDNEQVTCETYSDNIGQKWTFSEADIDVIEVGADANIENDIDELISLYDVMPETAEAMQEYKELCDSGEIEVEEIILSTASVPTADAGMIVNTRASSISTSKTGKYKGFKSQYYMQEFTYITYSSRMGITKMKANAYSDYAKGTIKLVAKYVANSALNAITEGTWSVASLLVKSLPTGVSGTDSIEHLATLYENYKTKRFTYILEGNQWRFGSRVERSNHYFENRIQYPKNLKKYANSPAKLVSSGNYSSGYEEKAYYSYVNGGYVEPIRSFTYKNIIFNSY